MIVSLHDLLHLDTLRAMRLLTDPVNFFQVEISAVTCLSPRDLPVLPFTPQGCLVLCDARTPYNEEPQYLQFVTELHDACAGALAVTFEENQGSLPQSILDLANELSLPIFEVDWNIRFSDILDEVVRAIQEGKSRVFSDWQTTLFNLFFDSRPLSDAIEIIARKTGFPACIISGGGILLCSSTACGEEVRGGWPCTAASIMLNGVMQGQLMLFQPHAQADFPDAAILQRCLCFPLSMWFYRDSIEKLTVMQLKSDFVYRLATGMESSLEETLYQGRQLSLPLDRLYVCAVLELQNSSPDSGTIETLAAYSSAVSAMITMLSKDLGVTVPFASRSPRFILYIECPDGEAASAERFIDLLEERIKKWEPSCTAYWGISEVPAQYGHFDVLYSHASLALYYSLHSARAQRRFTYQDSKPAHIAMLLSQDETLERDACALAETLNRYSASSGIDLFGTLQEYLCCNYNISETARKLFIHRQSLLYRLGKIEELSGLSLSDHQDLFLLETYVHAYNGY